MIAAPIFWRTAMRSWISGSIAAPCRTVLPSANTALRSTCSVAPTLGNGRRSSQPTSPSVVRRRPPSSWWIWAPSCSSTMRCQLTWRPPMSSPPRPGMRASPVRCRRGPHRRIGMRLLPLNSSSRSAESGVTSSACTLTVPAPSSSDSTCTPMARSISLTMNVSEMAGVL